ncbi:hypothetical protein C1J03_15670 [Sulfitobacter sp. SK012]|uniref:ankyrin repeat domain-containing protein n=1 Tax=Sulfitobacter sp. SK012 TaxID=1389005 RepID=UPI000E0A4FD5|nr:ankyrin repeat domain-containing protein [Sulfitobacter sp. SK012]AXI47321.1 hypothetical protein C1J03_15670 [Sulfitobacter sp. SK012]
MLALAESWQQLDHDAGVVNLGLKLHAERAFEVLALWSHRFDEGSEKVQDVKDILLRNYCLAMIEQTCDPARIIENTPKKAPHILIPAFYQRNDILRAMLEKHPGSVDTPRSDKRTAVFSACFFNNIEMLELLLEYKAEMNVAEDDGWRPIHAAAVGGDPAMTRRLIKAGATFDPQDAPQKIHPLHLAAQGGNKELADYYIKEQSVDPDLRDSAGRTVVMHAILNDDAQMVRYLVETHGCALDICTVDGPNSLEMSAIHVAARDGCRESIQTVIELGGESDCPMVNGSRAIHLAANNDFPEAVRILAKHGADVDAPGMNLWTKDDIDKAREQLTATSGAKDKINLTDWSPLHFATAKGHTKVARALIEAKADPNKQNGAKETPMHLAVEKGNDDVAMYLSANGANMEIRDKDGLTVLQKAIIRDRFALAKELLRQGALLSSYSHRNTMTDAHAATLVHVAAQEPEIKLLNLLIEHGPDLSLPNALGRTPAHIAAEAGLPDHLARLLHTDDTALEKVDVRGHTPFDSACASGDLKCIELIGKRCAEGTLAQTYPEALHIAVSHGRVRATGYLLGQGYDPQAYNDAGWTPLHIAAQRGRENVVKEILNHRINPLRPLRNDPDVTAFDLAAETGQAEVLKLLFHLRSPDALDLTDLIFLSLEHMHYDCAAYLLGLRRGTDSGLPVHPVTGLSIQELYGGQNAEMKKSKPTEERHSDALETHFGSVAKPTPAQTKQLKSQAVNATPQQYKTQSMMHGLASDLYPEFDRGETRLWSKMNETDLAAFVKRVAPVADRYELDGPELRGATRKLPWYDDVTLFQLFDPSFANPKLRIYYLEHQGNLYWLNGTSPPIHEINAKAPIKVNEANVLDYLRFFTFFVRGEEGPFYLCEHKDDPMIPSHAKIEKIIDGVVRPNTFEGMNDKGHYLCDGVVFYSNAIFIANFAVQPSGMVEMLDDEPIAADLPVKIDAPLS